MTPHSERARLALAHLAEADPALAALALWCEHRDGSAATRTEGDTILYGPEFPLRPLAEQVGLAGHHVLHVALRHPARMAAMAARMGKDFGADRYNLAADAVVNEAMLRAGHALPRPAPRLADLVDTADHLLADWDVDRLFMRLVRDSKQSARGKSEASERDLYAGGQPADGDAKAAEWRGRLARALDTGRRAGRGIGHAAGGLGVLPVAQVPWEVHLRGLVARAVSEMPRRSYRRPAGRWVAMEAAARDRGGPAPVFEPGQARDRRRPRIAVGLDSSTSIDDPTFARFAAEILGVAGRTGAEVHALPFDEIVHETVQVDPVQGESALARMRIPRGGGTSFVDVLRKAVELDASIAVILTDLDGEFGKNQRLPIVWAVPDRQCIDPPFGKVLRLDQ